ncbi:MAG: MBL fold metallo-hydrolase, partial [Halanaerobiales bacterium]|nr:MBL fold metallo-hydrolase [Halanaerobiales bacterium]
LFTHPHADHIMGFDDLRAINRIQKKEIPCYGNSETLEALKKKFEYIFNNKNHKYAVPSVKLIKINDGLKLNDVNVLPLSVKHNHQNVLGYRINNLAYITDCSFIPDSTMDLIKDVDFLILDALRYKKHPKHFNIEQALEVIKSLNINKAYLTHISHEIEHEEVNSSLPENVELAYDGLKLQI